MQGHDFYSLYSTKALEYVIAISYILLFIPFWRFVNGGKQTAAVLARAAAAAARPARHRPRRRDGLVPRARRASTCTRGTRGPGSWATRCAWAWTSSATGWWARSTGSSSRRWATPCGRGRRPSPSTPTGGRSTCWRPWTAR